MLVVWEPILSTDWRAPGGAALGRIADTRVHQFWDPNHVVASALNEFAKQKPLRPDPDCCVAKGFYWDEAILYPAGAHWNNPPASAFWNGPVYKIIPGLEKTLTDQVSSSAKN